jgi:hypothetical protein
MGLLAILAAALPALVLARPPYITEAMLPETLVDDSTTLTISNATFAAIEYFYTPHIQALLEAQGSGLATYQVDGSEGSYSAAEISMNSSIGFDYGINAKILLALLESLNGLVTDPMPAQEALDFAMGNPALRGFEEQVNWAAGELGRAYLHYVSELPSDQRHLAASMALQQFASSLPDESQAERLLDGDSPRSLVGSYQRLFGVSPQVAPNDIGDLALDQFSFMQKPFGGNPPITAYFDHVAGDADVTIFTDLTSGSLPYSGHTAFDYGVGWNEPILSVAAGAVAHAGISTDPYCYDGQINPNGPAKYVAVDHDLDDNGDPDFRILYWHLNDNTRPDGTPWADNDPVQVGEEIGEAGNTGRVYPCPAFPGDTAGTHLHFQVRADPNIYQPGGSVYSGEAVDPFGWWGTTRDDPIGDPYSRWLWSSSELVDDLGASFEKFAGYWVGRQDAAAYQNHAWLAGSSGQWAVWGLKAPRDGTYYFEVFTPDFEGVDYRSGVYDLFVHSEIAPGYAEQITYTIDQQANRGQWVRLGGGDVSAIMLGAGETVLIRLTVPAGGADTYTVFDAVRLMPQPIAGGLKYLRQHQNPEGGWGEEGSSTGITALVTLAFLNYGIDERDTTDTDGDGTADIQEAVQFLLDHYDPATGRFWGDDPYGEPAYTYDTSLGVLVLVAADRRNDPPQYASQIAAARDYLLSIQSVEENGYDPTDPNYGGWGFPRADWSDLANTQSAVMALDAAYAYLNLDKPDPDDPSTWTYKVLHYADSVQRSDDGGFDYQQDYFGVSVGGMTHAGIWTNLLAGRDLTHQPVQDALNWVQTAPYWTVTENPNRGSAALYYYYVTMARALSVARRTNLVVDDIAHDWFRELSAELMTGGHQPHEDGYWYNTDDDEWESDENLVTAYAILALETRTLPPGLALSMSIMLHSPADLHLYDAQGRHVGWNYETSQIELQIPGAEYAVGETQIVTLTSLTAGNYYVEMIGTDNGEYQLEVVGRQEGQAVAGDAYTGTITADQVQGSFLNVTAMEGALTIFSTQPAETPSMRLEPPSVTAGGVLGSSAEVSITVQEAGGVKALQDATCFASDLIGPNDSVISGSSFTFGPASFDLPAGNEQGVAAQLAIPNDVKLGRYEGHITVESANAGAKMLSLSVDVYPEGDAYLPYIVRAYSFVPPTNTWTTGTGLSGQTAYALTIHPGDCNTLFAGTGNGIFKSVDKGESWMPTGLNSLSLAPTGGVPFEREAMGSTVIPAVIIDPVNEQVVYAATWGDGVFKTIDGGASWTPVNDGLGDELWIYALTFDAAGQALYAGTAEGGVYTTTDGGAAWVAVNTGLGDWNVRSLVSDPITPSVLYAGTQGGVYKTSDGGASWDLASADLVTSTVWSLAVNPVNTQVVYAGVDGSGVYRSDDGGVSWTAVNDGLGTPTVYGLAVDPHDPGVIYAGAAGQGVYQSKNAGDSWAPINTGLGDLAIQVLRLDGAACHTLHAGTGNGVWEYQPW